MAREACKIQNLLDWCRTYVTQVPVTNGGIGCAERCRAWLRNLLQGIETTVGPTANAEPICRSIVRSLFEGLCERQHGVIANFADIYCFSLRSIKGLWFLLGCVVFPMAYFRSNQISNRPNIVKRLQMWQVGTRHSRWIFMMWRGVKIVLSPSGVSRRLPLTSHSFLLSTLSSWGG